VSASKWWAQAYEYFLGSVWFRFSDAGSKQAVVTKIRILIASPIIHVLVVTNKAASLRRRENAMHFWYLICVKVMLLSLKG
jgi:hypothetical protein